MPHVSHVPALVLRQVPSWSTTLLNINPLERAHIVNAQGRLDMRDSCVESSAASVRLWV